MLPPVLPCLPWFVSLFVATFFIVFCRVVGHFLKFLFLLRWLCKLFDKVLDAAWACAALAMCLQNVWAYLVFVKSYPFASFSLFHRPFQCICLAEVKMNLRLSKKCKSLPYNRKSYIGRNVLWQDLN